MYTYTPILQPKINSIKPKTILVLTPITPLTPNTLTISNKLSFYYPPLKNANTKKKTFNTPHNIFKYINFY